MRTASIQKVKCTKETPQTNNVDYLKNTIFSNLTNICISPYSKRVSQEHNDDDHDEAGQVFPCPLQWGGDEVQFRVQSQQMPQFHTGQQN